MRRQEALGGETEREVIVHITQNPLSIRKPMGPWESSPKEALELNRNRRMFCMPFRLQNVITAAKSPVGPLDLAALGRDCHIQ